jgi:type VI protein secretion system component VasK
MIAVDPDLLRAERAVNRGLLLTQGPGIVLMFGPWLAVWWLGAHAPPGEGHYGLVALVLILIIAGVVLPWLAWSIIVPHWRRWAYGQANDIQLLKRVAVERKLIWPEGHFLERTEIMSKQMREDLRALETGKRLLKRGERS